jgi:hypothetical protein
VGKSGNFDGKIWKLLWENLEIFVGKSGNFNEFRFSYLRITIFADACASLKYEIRGTKWLRLVYFSVQFRDFRVKNILAIYELQLIADACPCNRFRNYLAIIILF